MNASTGQTLQSVNALEDLSLGGDRQQPGGHQWPHAGHRQRRRKCLCDYGQRTLGHPHDSGAGFLSSRSSREDRRRQSRQLGPTVAANEMAAVYGTNLASTGSVHLPARFPLILGGTCVTLNNQAVPLVLSSPGQINFQIPPGLAAGKYPLVVRSIANQVASALGHGHRFQIRAGGDDDRRADRLRFIIPTARWSPPAIRPRAIKR